MKDLNWDDIESIIDEVLELPENQRLPYIRETCGNNIDLKKEVIELLNSIDESEGWLEDPDSYRRDIFEEFRDEENRAQNDQSFIGKKIGSYTIREKIGEGGMGLVFRGERTDDEFDHQVAIKIIRLGHATESNVIRFKREQQILAGLNHPGIARLFDGGVLDGGYPYIIMEYIDGIPIADYCRTHNCSIDEIIRLFCKVLEAVRYAHENLVIHRDLKPGNILITETEDVKILDFGISKLLEEDESFTLTQTNSRLLTLKYASPEQIRQENITTSTDLYSLGIVFFELLTGSIPFDLSDTTRYNSEQVILNDTPPKPSKKVTHPRLKEDLLGDLDSIALKAIRKDPEERYRVASEFLNDLNKFKRGLPVSARTDSLRYRSQKFIKRHRQSVLIALTTFLLLVGLTGFYLINITDQRNTARVEAEKAENVKSLLVDLFRSNDPITGDAESISLERLLEHGTDEILDRDLDPSVKIELLLILSTIYLNTSEFDKALALAQQSLGLSFKHFGIKSVPAAESLIKLGGLEHKMGNYAEAKEHYLQAKSILDDHANRSNPLYAELYHNLAFAEEQLGNYDTSRTLFQKSQEHLTQLTPIDSSLYVNNLKSMARGYYNLDNHQKGDSLLLKALDASKSFHGEDDVITSSILGDLGMFKMTVAEYDQARDYYNQSLEIKEKVYGEEGHVNYTATLTNLAVLEDHLGNDIVAESLYTKAMRIDKQLLGEDHPYVAMSKNHLAGIYTEREDFEKALEFYQQALNIYEDSYGAEHYYMAGMNRNYGNLLSLIGSYQEAESYLEKSEEIYQSYDETDKDNFAQLYKVKGEHYLRSGKYQLAVDEFSRASDLFDEYEYNDYIQASAESLIKMAMAYEKLGNPVTAKNTLSNVYSRIDTSEILSNNSTIQQLLSETETDLAETQ